MTKAERERLIEAVLELQAFEPYGLYMVTASDFEDGYINARDLLNLLADFGDDEERG